MSKTNFTQRTLASLAPREQRFSVFDEKTRSLAVEVHPTGRKTFFHLQKVQGWPQRTTLGVFPDMTVEEARGKAAELNAKLSKWKSNDYEGANPVTRQKKVVTLGDVLAHYTEHHLKSNAKNPDSAVAYANWQFDKYCSALRNRPLSSIRREDIRELHDELQRKHGAVTANRTVTFLRTVFNHALHPDIALWVGINPCAKPNKFLTAETSRERTIQRDEAPTFFRELEKEKHTDLRDFLLLALSTGARKSTILAMRWEEIDFERALWKITSPKGKRGVKAHIVPLTKLAVTVLKSRPRINEYVFYGRKGHLTTVKKPWHAFLQRTGLTDLHVHDLRRTLATQEGDTGASTEIIQKTLGHAADSAATAIYDRSDRRDDVRTAIDTALGAMLSAGKTSAQKLMKP